MTQPPRILCDEMLGKLARDLRALGYDTAYMQDVADDELLTQASSEDRWLITRDRLLAERAGEQGILLSSLDPAEQLEDVVDQLRLKPSPKGFLSRCILCNRSLEPGPGPDPQVPSDVDPEGLVHCPACARTYWEGTHVEDMRDRLGHVLGRSEPEHNR
ncbi:MAG: Mut7-C RNAse domain-containing protein [Candidatus Thermoplasmatota archaeon]|nr:Mut7-C RNAse domain-containing protein [Candidatus Thermoplasmatota archaeon]